MSEPTERELLLELRAAVIEAARDWNGISDDPTHRGEANANEQAKTRLEEAVNALEEFEQKREH